MRLNVCLALGFAVFATPALAADPSPGRYTLAPSREGFVRLDTRTGATSHCGFDGKAWVCEPFAEGETALQTRVDSLATEVARLTAVVRALSGPKPPAAPVSVPVSAPVSAMSERAVDRLLGLVRRLKHGNDA